MRIGVLAWVAFLGGCAGGSSTRPDADPSAFAPATALTAALAGTGHIELRWKDNATREAGYFVEYTTTLDDPFVVLNAVPHGTTMALHPDLAPDTRFIYRVTPYFGEASHAVSTTTARAADAAAPAEPEPEPMPVPSGDKPLRDTRRASQAAPAKLTARLAAPTSVALEWEDRSSDEDGYLVEGTGGFQEFRVLAYVRPDVTSYRVDDLPPQTKCYFRVRAFYRGLPSRTAEQKTGPGRYTLVR